MSLRTAAIDFVAAQNVTDREELMFRAHRHASNLTGQLPVPTAQRVVQAFVAAVFREAESSCPKDNDCDDCGAGGGEDCRPWCCGEAKDNDEKEEKKTKKSHRTAAVVADFPDELMF